MILIQGGSVWRKYLASLTATLALIACEPPASPDAPTATPTVPTAVQGGQTVHQTAAWPADAPQSPLPTSPFGDPTCSFDATGHTRVKHYTGFALDYDDRILAARWTSYKLTAAVVRTHKDIERDPKFWGDPELEAAGLRITAQADYTNPKGVHIWDRGHMVPFNDARCWGAQAAHDCFVTSNIVPQDKVLNEQAWEGLEQRVDAFAKLKGTIWVFTGPIYDLPLHAFAPHRAVPAPDRLSKVVVWREKDGQVGSVAWVMPNTALDKQADLDHYVAPMADVERATSVRFMPGR